ncbi:MAG: sugar ABC transporter permease [Limnochordales bacterium]|nr:sugar ABC transporter permease [Limnochordales bacterium]
MSTEASRAIRVRRLRIPLHTQQAIMGYLFITPWIVGFLLFLAYPLVHSFWLSFNNLENLVNFQLRYIGLQNYVEAFLIDVNFLPMLYTTIRNAIIDVPLIIVFSLFTAIVVNQRLPGQGFFRAIFFLPVVIGSGLVIQQLFNQYQAEMGQAPLVRGIDVPTVILVVGPEFARTVLDLMNRLALVLWRTGVQILLFLAGLQGISSTLYEAARVDGASEWEKFWKITLPMISPIILLVAIYTIVDSFTDIFNPILNYIKNLAFAGQFRMGYAAALGWIYFIVVFALMGLVFWIGQRHTFYAGER